LKQNLVQKTAKMAVREDVYCTVRTPEANQIKSALKSGVAGDVGFISTSRKLQVLMMA
jgi:hypothetical protein